jgi:hypothetical protein
MLKGLGGGEVWVRVCNMFGNILFYLCTCGVRHYYKMCVTQFRMRALSSMD